MKRELEDLVEAARIGEEYFSLHFTSEPEPHETVDDVARQPTGEAPVDHIHVSAQLQWRAGVRGNIEALIARALDEHRSALASRLALILEDVWADDVIAAQTYEVPANTRVDVEHATVSGLLRRRAKIRAALKALVRTLEPS